ncbi:MAG: tetratricopeptide repeat protein [Candidatus Aminicenantales bacterium]
MDDEQLLESWKEVSAFLGRDARTCMRWEQELGLPVHRLDGTRRARVFAYKDELSSWLEQKLHEHDRERGPDPATSRRLRLRRARIIAIAAVLVLAAAALVNRAFVPMAPPPLPPGYVQPVLAVLSFENRSGDPALDYWRESLAELLVTDLSQSRYLRVVSTDQMLTALRRLGLADAPAYSSEDIARIALHTHAGHILRGSIVKAGSTIVITAGLNEPGSARTASPPSALKFVARSEYDVIRQVDKLARSIKKSLHLTRAQIVYDFANEAGQAVTSFPQALRLYVKGRLAQTANRWEDAISALEQAIAIDPRFAMAYRALSVAHHDLEHYPESRAALEKCLALPDRLPAGEARFIEGAQAFYDQDYAKAISLLQAFLADHPGHLNAMWCLAYAYGDTGDIDKAIELQSVVTRERNTVLDARALAVYLQRKGRYQEAAEICLSFLQNVEDAWYVRQMLASCYAFLGEFDLAEAEAQKNFQARPATALDLGEILVFKGDLGAAEAVAGPQLVLLERGRFAAHIDDHRRILEKAQAGGNALEEARAEYWLADALEKAGRYAEAGAAFSEFQRLAGPVGSGNETVIATGCGFPYFPSQRKRDLVVRARLEVKMGRTAAAQRTAAELKSVVEAGIVDRDVRFTEYVLGLIDLARGIPLAAVDHLERACSLLNFEDYFAYDNEQAIFYDALARAQFESGDRAAARTTYEKITQLTTGRRIDGDIYARAFYHLGRIAGREGQEAAARGYYSRFLALWKDADPGLADVADATARLNDR